MFAAFYSVTAPVETLVRVAQSFSPRVEVSGRLVLCDLHGVERLFGGPRDVAEHIRRALVDTGAVRLALAPTTFPRRQRGDRHRLEGHAGLGDRGRHRDTRTPERQQRRRRVRGRETPATTPGTDVPSGWRHPRDTHQGPLTRRHVRGRGGCVRPRRAARRTGAPHRADRTTRDGPTPRRAARTTAPRAPGSRPARSPNRTRRT